MMMKNKEVIFNKKDYKSYKDFYTEIYEKLDGKNTIDFEDEVDLGYHADILNEFLWYKSEEGVKFVFVGFDLENIDKRKTYDDYEWQLVFKIMKRFVEEYPNNTLEFRDE